MSHEQSSTPIEIVEQHNLPTEELAEKEKAARSIFTLHRAQRYSQAGDCPILFEAANIWPTSYSDNSETTSSLLSTEKLFIRSVQTQTITYDNFITADINDQPYLRIPIRLSDKVHTIKTETGGAFVFADHTDSLIPSPKFFSYATRQNIPIEDLFVSSFTKMAFPSFPKDFDKYLQSWGNEANKSGFSFNKDHVLNQIRTNIENGHGAPMHCYLALPPSNQEVQEKYITAAKESMLHKQPSIAISGKEFVSLYLTKDNTFDPEKLPYLALYDSIPVDITPNDPSNKVEKTREFQEEIAVILWRDLIDYYNMLDMILDPGNENPFQVDKIVPYITEISAINGKMAISSLTKPHDIPQIPKSYGRYTVLGILNTRFLAAAIANPTFLGKILTRAEVDFANQNNILSELGSFKQLPEPENDH